MKETWKRRALSALLSAGMLVGLTACGPAGNVDLMQGVTPGVVEDLPALQEPGRAAVADFGLRLLRQSAGTGENLLFSPLSVVTALAMTGNGAERETREEVYRTLGMDPEQLNAFLHDYLDTLTGEEGGMLHAANSIWFTDDPAFTVQEDFLQTNADYYGAELYRLPMNDAACGKINRWVKEQTVGMIPEIVKELPEDTIMCLVNALAFEAEWPEPYEKNQIREEAFTTRSGELVNTDFMYGEDHLYLENQWCRGFLKPYRGGRYAFGALLPEEGTTVAELVEKLDGEGLCALLVDPEEVPVHTVIPKFETEYSTELSELLKEMGMPLAFDPERAQLGGLGKYEGGNLYVDQVLHKTFLSMGEKGTRAGAATAVVVNAEAAPDEQEPKEVRLDRPFLYMLVDLENQLPFFLGTMEVPEG